MFHHRSTLAVLGVAALALVGGCAAPGSTVRPEIRPGVPGGSAPAPQLVKFYDQPVEFGPCLPYAQTELDEKLFVDDRYDCARVQVPVDYADPEGPRGEIALLRVKARGEKIGSLLVDPGGPGSSGMNFVALYGSDVLGQALTKGPVGDRFDVIGFDPRGVGASTPKADCFTDAEYDRGVGFLANPLPDVTDEQQAREVARRCTEGSGGEQALVNFGTSTVVRDMDVLRGALGDEKLSYLGYSYGTELGAMYAEAFPHYGLDPDSNVVIRCMDNPRRTPAEQAELARQIYGVAPFLDPGRPASELHSECEGWPQQPSRREPWLTGDVDVPPTLTISVTGDPATPHQGGINLAHALKGSLLTVDDTQHGIALLGQSECVDRAVADYLIDLKAPPADAHCTV